MQENKLQLKDIQHYPIGGNNALMLYNTIKKDVGKIWGIHSYPQSGDIFVTAIHVDNVREALSLSEVKPILRPMSDLYKPCLEGGKIPIEIIGKIFEPNGILLHEDENLYSYGWNTHVCDDWQGYEIGWIDEYNWFGVFYDTYNYENQSENFTGDILPYKKEVLEKLHKWHYDINNLIGQRLALDINTIQS